MLGKKRQFSILAVIVTLGLFHTPSCSLRNEISPSPDISHPQTDMDAKKNDQSETSSTSSENGFKTFRSTGEDLCLNAEGRPVILLFTRTSCSHCQWIGDFFDSLVMEYVEKGLIEAHHYDMESKDDLLTETVEDEVPRPYLDIGRRRDPKGYLPYFNFGCRYERIGTGYEESDDLSAEVMEMTRVIETLLRDM
jgi:thiol-disulfide isomerase/thioredoxin